MKSIKLSSIHPGTVTDCEFFSESGELLLAKGITVTQRHIDILKRRNVFELYDKNFTEDDEVKHILSVQFQELEDLRFDEDKSISPGYVPKWKVPPKALQLSEFKNIKSGAEGLEQLNKSEKAHELDRKFKAGRTPDRPIGPPLKKQATELRVAERDEEYKIEMSDSYNNSLEKLKIIINAIANGEKINGNRIWSIAEEFVKKFVTDKNILLNLSCIRTLDEIYIYNQTLNVCLLAINIAAASGYSKRQVIEIAMGALLYDVGMLLVPKEIYLKKGRLNKGEWYEIKKHPIFGLHLLERISNLPESVPYAAYQSHEREDGEGYPKKRNSRFIHRFAKIIQVADSFIALSSPRCYRRDFLPYKAMEATIKRAKQGVISGDFVKFLLSYVSLFPVGSLVELNNHLIAKVIKANGTSFAKPTVSVLTDEKNNLLTEKYIYQINLSEDTEIHVIRALPSNFLPDISLMTGF